jgi:integrase/recombinase XerD
MPPKGARRKGIYHPNRPPVEWDTDAGEPESIWAYAQRYKRWQMERNYSHHTYGNRERTLRAFAAWCAERGLVRPHDITKPILERWQRHLYLHRKPDGQPLSPHSQRGHTEPLIAFFKWLARENYILTNPASDLQLPRIGRRLPRTILTIAETEKVLGVCKVSTPVGIRDRAMLETLYSTGLRRQELIDLKLYDVDADRGVVLVREGKGRKDRMIPIGSRALAWIEKYREDVRPEFASGADDGTLFLTVMGTAFKPNRLAEIARFYIDGAAIGKRGACHIFRHTMATLMLEGGADIRYIQAILGHTQLSTTEIYTQVSIKQLKAVHTLTHPAKPIGKADRYTSKADADQAPASGPADADMLLEALEMEADEEDGRSESC